MPPILSGKLPKCGIKQRFSNAIDAYTHPTHTGKQDDERIIILKFKSVATIRSKL